MYGEIKKADLVIGIPSFNNEKTIRYVTEVVGLGAKRYFPELKTVIINSDGGSTDNTKREFLNSETPKGIEKLHVKYEGISGKGSALKKIFTLMEEFDAKYGIVVDSDLRSIKPDWIERLLTPIVEGHADYVTPYYIRDKYDGTITNNIVFPLTSSLYGKKIRQPIGGDFGFSRDIATHWLNSDLWNEEIYKFGIDIFMTTEAIIHFKVTQSYLGVKIHDVKDPGASLGPMFYQVVGTIFELMKRYKERWERIKEIDDVEIYGERREEAPEPIKVDLNRLLEKFKDGVKKNEGLIKTILKEDSFERLKASLEREDGIELNLWIHILYEYSSYYKELKEEKEKKDTLSSLVPLYFGRVANTVILLKEADPLKAEAQFNSWVDTFLKEKDYLLSLWK